MQKKVLVTSEIPFEGIELLKNQNLDVQVKPGQSGLDKGSLIQEIKNADALICLLSEKIDAEVLSAAEQLKIVANYAVGYNNIDLLAAKKNGVVVTNTPDVLTAATADLTWALILSVSKRICESEKYLRAGSFTGWQPKLFLGADVTGKTLGIIGAGRIGQAVAKRAKGFDMKIQYVSRKANPNFEIETGAKYVSLGELLESSDFISLHCPLTEETHHLLDHKNLQKIKKSAFLINTARGPVIDEKALVQVLKDGTLAGAGLDVYEFEPQVTPELMQLDNVVLLPHIGSATVETRAEMSRICARNVIAVLENQKPLTPVF